jgi:polyphenol oxidase
VAGGILLEAIAQLESAGCRRADLLVALGPAVSGANYQVETAVAEQLARALPATATGSGIGTADLGALQACAALLDDPQPGRHRLDIRAASRRQLELAGVPAPQISVCPLCTVAEPLLFHSWRRDQVKAVQWSGIVSQQLEEADSEG